MLLDLVCGGRGARVRSRVAVVTFSDTADLYMRYKDHLTLGGFVGKMDELLTFATGGTTQTHLALTEVEQAQQSRPLKPDLWPNLAGFVGFSDERASVVLLITDGKPSNPDRAVGMSRALQEKGNTVVVVGVTDSVDQATLNSLASEGKGIRVEDFDILAREETIALVVQQAFTQFSCADGALYNFDEPVLSKTITEVDLIIVVPELVTASFCADACLQEVNDGCKGFSFQTLASGGDRGVCRLGRTTDAVPLGQLSSPRSLNTCDELGWSVFASSQDQNVCGTWNSTASAQCGLDLNKMTFVSALDACESAGSRLCTGQELQNDVAKEDGCDFGPVWTSDECGQPGAGFFKVAPGSGGTDDPTECEDGAKNARHVRCCANVRFVNPSRSEINRAYASSFTFYQ